MKDYKIAEPPKPVGEWVLPGASSAWSFRVHVYKKPRWLTRKLMKALVEWEYKEHK